MSQLDPTHESDIVACQSDCLSIPQSHDCSLLSFLPYLLYRVFLSGLLFVFPHCLFKPPVAMLPSPRDAVTDRSKFLRLLLHPYIDLEQFSREQRNKDRGRKEEKRKKSCSSSIRLWAQKQWSSKYIIIHNDASEQFACFANERRTNERTRNGYLFMPTKRKKEGRRKGVSPSLERALA